MGFRSQGLGHSRVGSYRYRSLIDGLYTIYLIEALLEALYTPNSPPVFSFKGMFQGVLRLDGSRVRVSQGKRVVVGFRV